MQYVEAIGLWIALLVAVVYFGAMRPEQARQRRRHRLDGWQREVLEEYEALKLDDWEQKGRMPLGPLGRCGQYGVPWWLASSIARRATYAYDDAGKPDGEEFSQRLHRLAEACEALSLMPFSDMEPIPCPGAEEALKPEERVEAMKALWH